MDYLISENIEKTVSLIKNAEAIAIFAGAGMSVDSGLEQYRGENGLWTKSVTINNKTYKFEDLLTHIAFEETPYEAWGFIGNLIEKYKNTQPHSGYYQLLELLKNKEYFVITSNCDEYFKKAGFSHEKIYECHGSIFNMQCLNIKERGIHETSPIKLDKNSHLALDPLPKCPKCGENCRPNIYMFYDWFWESQNSVKQQINYNNWHKNILKTTDKIVAIEIGAGKTINTIRKLCEKFTENKHPLVRINPHDCEIVCKNQISIPDTAKNAISAISGFI